MYGGNIALYFFGRAYGALGMCVHRQIVVHRQKITINIYYAPENNGRSLGANVQCICQQILTMIGVK